MNIGIIGGGSTGLLLSYYLARHHSVTVYVRREEQKDKLSREGLLLSNSTAPMKTRAKLSFDLQEEDCLIICVKQSAVSSIIPLLQDIDENTPLLFLQNGMGHLDDIKKLKNPIYLGVIEHGAMKHGDNLVEHTGKGKIKIAAFQGDKNRLYLLAKTLNQPDFPFEYSEDYLIILKEKLIINVVINPLTALFQVPNGKVLLNPYIHKMALALCEEAAAVLGMDFAKEWVRVTKVCENTAKNRSSMLKDIMNSRKTEIDAISGYIVKKGENFTIPYTTFLYESIKAIETEKGIRD